MTGVGPMDEPQAVVGSYEWFKARPMWCAMQHVSVVPLPPLVSWLELEDLGWRLKAGVWLPPGAPT